ncbi:hypothetical protein SCARD494_00008 [Seiridium cardinale]
MTKPWDRYESTIKELYAKHTLATVRQIMKDNHGFDASVRAYRQKLDEWGQAKYKKRAKKSGDSSSGGHSGSKEPKTGSSSKKSHQEKAVPSSSATQAVSSTGAAPGGANWSSTHHQVFDPNVRWDTSTSGGDHSQASDLATQNYSYPIDNNDGVWGDDGIWYPFPATYYGTGTSWNASQPNTTQGQVAYSTGPATGLEEYEYDDEGGSDYSGDDQYGPEGGQ